MPLPNDGEVVCIGACGGRTLLNRTDIICWRCGGSRLDRTKAVGDVRRSGLKPGVVKAVHNPDDDSFYCVPINTDPGHCLHPLCCPKAGVRPMSHLVAITKVMEAFRCCCGMYGGTCGYQIVNGVWVKR